MDRERTSLLLIKCICLHLKCIRLHLSLGCLPNPFEFSERLGWTEIGPCFCFFYNIMGCCTTRLYPLLCVHNHLSPFKFIIKDVSKYKVGSQRAVVPEVSGRAWVTSVSDQVMFRKDKTVLMYLVSVLWRCISLEVAKPVI